MLHFSTTEVDIQFSTLPAMEDTFFPDNSLERVFFYGTEGVLAIFWNSTIAGIRSLQLVIQCQMKFCTCEKEFTHGGNLKFIYSNLLKKGSRCGAQSIPALRESEKYEEA